MIALLLPSFFLFSAILNSDRSLPSRLSFNLETMCSPGLYEIRCLANNKKYIGEAQNILDRLGKHSSNLQKNLGECAELQADWLKHGPSQFEARVLFSGPQWQLKSTRVQKETEIIHSYAADEVYNEHSDRVKTQEKNYRVVCEIHGVQYDSMEAAHIATKESLNQLKTKLQNKHPGYVIIGKKKARVQCYCGKWKNLRFYCGCREGGRSAKSLYNYETAG